MFTKATQYGIKSVIYIWKQSLAGERCGVKEISQQVDVPEPFTAKILQPLVKKGIIGSQKGPSGGFYVSKVHEKYTLKELVEALEGDRLFSGCALGLQQCSETNPCPLHHDAVRVRSEIIHMLTRKSLKQMAEEVDNGDAVLARFA